MNKNEKATYAEPISKKSLIWLIVSIVVYVVVLLLPLQGLSDSGQKALAALAWIVVVLISNCLPIMLSNCIFAAMVIVSGAMTQAAFLSAFGSSPFMLCLGLGVVALGMSKTNLGARISYMLMTTIGRTPSLMLLAIMITGYITSALIANLPALLAVCPIIVSILQSMKETPGESNMGKAMFIGLIWAGGAGGLAFISSAATNAAGVGAIASASEGTITVSFAQFSIMGIPTGIVMLITGWIFLSIWFRLNKTAKVLPREQLKQEMASLGKMDNAEVRYTLYLVIMILLFFFGGNFGINPPTVAIIMMAVMLCPGIGLVTWDEAAKKTNWGMLFQIGFFVGFATAISDTGLGDWLTTVLFGWINTTDPLILLILVTCIAHVANILVPGGGSGLVIIPSLYALTISAGMDTAFLMLMVCFVCAWSQFQPIQPQYLVVRGNTAGYLQIKDFILPNIIITVVWSILLIPLFYVIAPMAGLL